MVTDLDFKKYIRLQELTTTFLVNILKRYTSYKKGKKG